jgi:hypothetical protein
MQRPYIYRPYACRKGQESNRLVDHLAWAQVNSLANQSFIILLS